MEGHTASLIIIFLCLIMSGYFSATETAFLSFNKLRMKTMAEKGNKRASLVLKLSANYDSMLSTILIGHNIVHILGPSLTTILFVNLIGEANGASVATIVTTIVVLIFGEVSPKSIAKESPEKFALFSAPLLNILITVLTPFNFLFRQWKKILSLIFKSSGDTGITEEELLSFVEEAEQDGGIDEQESMIIKSAISFTELEAIDILTPRVDISAVSTDATKEDIAKVFTETAFSRLPLYEDTIDHIKGIIYHKDFHNYVYNTDKTIDDIVRPALFVPENKKIDDLLKDLQQQKLHIAVVLDEFGGTVGIITLEDILEQIVGEIWDEHDEVNQEIEIKSENEYIVLGNTNINKLYEALDVEYDEEEETFVIVNGLVMSQLGKVPSLHDNFDYKGYHFDVISMDNKRVEKVRITKLPKEDSEK